MINETHKKLYNLYLAAMAKKAGRGYKKRENFDNIGDLTEVALIKLEHFFNQYPNISPLDFFAAGFQYCVDNWVPIDFFKTRKALVYYNRYAREKQLSSPDSPEILQSFVNGLKFIVSFLKENNIKSLAEYKDAINGMNVPWYLIHLKEQKISFYHLHAFEITLESIPKDYKNLVFNGFDNIFNQTRDAYLNSTKMIQIGNRVAEKIHK